MDRHTREEAIEEWVNRPKDECACKSKDRAAKVLDILLQEKAELWNAINAEEQCRQGSVGDLLGAIEEQDSKVTDLTLDKKELRDLIKVVSHRSLRLHDENAGQAAQIGALEAKVESLQASNVTSANLFRHRSQEQDARIKTLEAKVESLASMLISNKRPGNSPSQSQPDSQVERSTRIQPKPAIAIGKEGSTSSTESSRRGSPHRLSLQQDSKSASSTQHAATQLTYGLPMGQDSKRSDTGANAEGICPSRTEPKRIGASFLAGQDEFESSPVPKKRARYDEHFPIVHGSPFLTSRNSSSTGTGSQPFSLVPKSAGREIKANKMAMVTGSTRDEPDGSYAHDSPKTTATYSPIADLDNNAGGIKQEESDAVVRPSTETSTSTSAHRTCTCSWCEWCDDGLPHDSNDESVEDEGTPDGLNGAPSTLL